MPRRNFDDDDDLPSRRSRRSRYEDEDDDYDDLPRRRGSGSNSNSLPMILGLVGGGFILLIALAVGGIFAFRAAPVAQPPQQQFGGPPQAAGPQPVFVPPGVPQGVIPDEVALECTISNLRLEQGFGGRQALTFDYEFPAGRPFGGDRFIAVVTEPGRPAMQVNLVGFINARGKASLDRLGGIGNFVRGTTIYIGKGFGNPKRVSNVLTLQ